MKITKLIPHDRTIWIAAHVGLLFAAASAASLAATLSPDIPGLGFAFDIAMSMALLASAGGSLCYMAVRPGGTARGAFFSGVLLASTTLIYAELYRRSGPGALPVSVLEYVYLASPALGAAGLLLRSLATRRNVWRSALSCCALAIVFAIQIPLHAHLAAPAAQAIYNTPALISSRIGMEDDLEELGFQSIEDAIFRSAPYSRDRLLSSVAPISQDAPAVRHAWTVDSPLPNLPAAEVLLVYDGTDEFPKVWALPIEEMTRPGRSWLVAHLLVTAWSGFLLLASGLVPVLATTPARNFSPR